MMPAGPGSVESVGPVGPCYRRSMKTLPLFRTDVTLVDSLPGVDSLLPSLKAALLKERRRSPQGEQRSQVNGWHSPPDLAAREQPYFRQTTRAIVNAVSKVVRARAQERDLTLPPHAWRVLEWAIILDPGGYNRLHDHGDSHYSVAFYVDAGDPKTPLGGCLSFVDPRRDATVLPGVDLDPTILDIPVKTGMLAIFPGYLQHAVQPYDGTRPRIVISANLTMDLDQRAYQGTIVQ